MQIFVFSAQQDLQLADELAFVPTSGAAGSAGSYERFLCWTGFSLGIDEPVQQTGFPLSVRWFIRSFDGFAVRYPVPPPVIFKHSWPRTNLRKDRLAKRKRADRQHWRAQTPWTSCALGWQHRCHAKRSELHRIVDAQP